MKLLLEYNNEKFSKYTEIYQENYFPYIEFFEKEIKSNGYSEDLPPSVEWSIWAYSIFMQWPIRKLEYSFIFHNCKPFLKSNMKTLDAGCGLTPTARWFASQGCDAYGVDFDKETIRYLQNKQSHLYDPNVHLSTQNLIALKFEDNTFDLITCISVLEHLPRLSSIKAISEMLRVLRSGGMLILTVDFTDKERKYRSFKENAKGMIRAGGKLFRRGKIKELAKKLIRNTLPHFNEGGPYDPETLMSDLVDVYRNYFQENMPKITVDGQSIRQFWNSHWKPGCLYEKDGEDRNYVSVGMILKK